MWQFNKKKNILFDNDYNIHISSRKYEENRYGLHLDLLTISYNTTDRLFDILREVGAGWAQSYKHMFEAHLPFTPCHTT